MAKRETRCKRDRSPLKRKRPARLGLAGQMIPLSVWGRQRVRLEGDEQRGSIGRIIDRDPLDQAINTVQTSHDLAESTYKLRIAVTAGPRDEAVQIGWTGPLGLRVPEVKPLFDLRMFWHAAHLSTGGARR